jgi:hypothetical protein
MSEDLEQAGIDAVDRFINTWNSRDAEQWAASLHYPHVRPSPYGEIHIAPTLDDYVARVDYQATIDSGWDHSEWDYKHVIHVSPKRIHVAGQWSRYNVDNEVILTTPIVYVCTKIDGAWGIQSRFGADYVDEDTDTTEMMTRGLNLIQDFINHYSNGNNEACAELLNFPHFGIGNSELNVTESAGDFKTGDAKMTTQSLLALQTGRHSLNAALEVKLANGETRQAVVHVNDRDGHLGIQAWSLLNPNELAED